MIGFAVFANYKNIPVSNPDEPPLIDDRYLNLVVGTLASASNGTMRILFGYLYDKFGFRKLYNSMLLMNIVISLIIF